MEMTSVHDTTSASHLHSLSKKEKETSKDINSRTKAKAGSSIERGRVKKKERTDKEEKKGETEEADKEGGREGGRERVGSLSIRSGDVRKGSFEGASSLKEREKERKEGSERDKREGEAIARKESKDITIKVKDDSSLRRDVPGFRREENLLKSEDPQAIRNREKSANASLFPHSLLNRKSVSGQSMKDPNVNIDGMSPDINKGSPPKRKLCPQTCASVWEAATFGDLNWMKDYLEGLWEKEKEKLKEKEEEKADGKDDCDEKGQERGRVRVGERRDDGGSVLHTCVEGDGDSAVEVARLLLCDTGELLLLLLFLLFLLLMKYVCVCVCVCMCARLSRNNSISLLNTDISVNDVITNGPKKGQTPLHIAAHLNNHQLIDLLLSKGANRDATDAKGLTPIMHAILTENVESVTLLLDPKWDPSSNPTLRDLLLCLAIYIRSDAIVELILTPKSVTQIPLVTSQLTSSKNGESSKGNQTPNVKYVVRKCLPIHLAVKVNRPDILQTLLSKIGNDSSVNYRISLDEPQPAPPASLPKEKSVKKMKVGSKELPKVDEGTPSNQKKEKRKSERPKTQKARKIASVVVTEDPKLVENPSEISSSDASSLLGNPDIDSIEISLETVGDGAESNPSDGRSERGEETVEDLSETKGLCVCVCVCNCV